MYFGKPLGEPKYNSTSKIIQPYWLVNRLIRCLLYDSFLLTFIVFIVLSHSPKNRSILFDLLKFVALFPYC